MLEIFNLEKQAGKRVKNLLLHKSTAAGINAATAKFVISLHQGSVVVHLYDAHTRVREIELKEITDFFGKEYDATKVAPFKDYLSKTAETNQIPVPALNVVICENKEQMGCHLYNEGKYVKRIPTLEILSKFNSDEE
jgi:hypothetical protein